MNENGLVEIPIDWMLHPTPDMNARERIESRVRNIFDSIGKYGVQPKRFVSLMWKEDLVARGFDPENPKFDPSIALGPVPMYTIVGDHTSAGLQRWHGLKPNNIKFQKACVEMVVSEKTEEALTLIRHAGTTENTIQSMSEANSMWDNIAQLQRNYVRIEEEYKSAGAEVVKAEKAKVRKIAELGFTQSAATLCTMKAMANWRGEMWELIEKIFKGEVNEIKGKNNKVKKFVKPTSANSFKSMSGIPEDILKGWLKQIIAGTIAVKDFGDNCIKYKKESAIMEDIVDFINQTEQKQFVDWDDACEEYEFLEDEDWFKMITGSCGKNLKDPLPAAVKNNILQLIKKAKQTKVYIFLYIII